MASTAKENILKKIRQALSNPAPLPFPKSEGNNSVFHPPADDLEVLFAEEFTKLQGKFAYCVNEQDLKAQLHQLIAAKKWDNVYCVEDQFAGLGLTFTTGPLKDSDVSITGCEYLIARTGGIVMSSAQASGRTVSVYAPVHICIGYTYQLVYDVKGGLHQIKEKYKTRLPSLITFATGPSRTADIEKTLVVGVHGPKEVYLFLVEGSKPV